jgi:methyl-accepting chemotaxis protein
MLSRLPLAVRFAIVVIVLAGGFAVFGAVAFRTLDRLQVNGPVYQRIVQGKDLIADVLPPPEYVIESYLVSLQLRDALGTPVVADLEARLRRLKAEYDERHAFWLREDLSGELREALLGRAHPPAERFYDLAFGRFLPAAHAGDAAGVAASLVAMQEAYDEHRAAVDRVVALASERNRGDESEAAGEIAAARRWLIGLLGLSMGLAVLLAAVVSRQVLRQVGGEPAYAAAVARRVADGDFATPVECRRGTEGSVLAALRAMQSQLSARVGGFLDEVSADAAGLTDAARDLAAVAAETRASLRRQRGETEQVATATEEMAASVQEVAHSAARASAAAEQANSAAVGARGVVERVGQQIRALSDEVATASEVVRQLEADGTSIGAVVGVITGIAEQTNLLALNAAIEAARAGEQGRGFAVVADEVRTLALRTRESTAQIERTVARLQGQTTAVAQVMQRSASDAAAAVGQATDAMRSIDEVGTAVATINDMNAQIATAVEEQGAVSREISRNVAAIAHAAEDTETGSHRTAAAAEQLVQLAAGLKSLLGRFRLEAGAA